MYTPRYLIVLALSIKSSDTLRLGDEAKPKKVAELRIPQEIRCISY